MTQKDYKEELIEKVKENYLSVALGVLVFLVAVTLIFKSGSPEDMNITEETQETPKEKTYVVQPGDSVSSIAKEQLGSMDHAEAIIKANNITNPNTIEVGQTLMIPDVAGEVMTPDADKNATPSPTPTAAMKKAEGEKMEAQVTPAMTISITGDSYTVKKGDHLWDIAQRAYGDGNKYTLIIEANKLRNPDRLEEGTVLKLPRSGTK
jgi:nucleoid-associated protein YgaU